jgi:hypothetical protein
MRLFHRIRHPFRCRLAAAGIAVLVAPLALADAPTPPELTAEIAALDAAMFDGFNHCEQPAQLEKYLSYFADDLEFYHDNGGLARGIERQRVDTAKYVCGKFARELVPGTFAVFPIKDFGAISRGVHRFCHFDSGRCEGEADFLIIYRKEKDGSWKVTRVVSYGHRPLAEPAPPAAATGSRG